ncbi:XRE family transcriptional regulator [Tenacibaculum dicentrarchi]|nr:XRE family transcriptional regulator [Tenacibaculum dicentrarchi]
MKVNNKQLTFAREYRGFSQTELSSKIAGLSQPNLSKFEKGLETLSEEIINKIISFLDFPIEFLSKNISNETHTAHYRKRTTITKGDKTKIEHSYRLIGYIIDEMAGSLMWPEFSLKTLDIEDGYTPQYIAQYTRKILGLKPNEPVKEICNLLETNGIIIVELDSIEKFDGVSFVTDDGYPTIVINRNFSNDRKRFTISHELGHLLMHSVNNPAIPKHRDQKQIEKEADKFASEFLMPKEAIKNSLYNIRLSYLGELKRYWLTSMASIIRRAKDLDCITKETYTYLNIEFSRKGLRKNEGIDVYIDEPELFKKGYSMHKNELAYSDFQMSSAFSIPVDVIKRFCDNSKNKSKLRVLI